MTTCPKCGSKNYANSVGRDSAYWCPSCDLAFTEWQQAEIEHLRAALKEIEEHPHCVTKQCFLTSSGLSYLDGVSHGHRCAAEIAKKAREGK